MQQYYENWKSKPEVKRKLRERVLDPDGILTGNGYIEGVYEFLYYNVKTHVEISAYIGQAGDDPTAPDYVASDIYERCLQHLKRMLGNDKYFTYWTGLDSENADWKIMIRVLCEEKNHSNRLQLESTFIDKKHPILQNTKGGMFKLYPTKFGYNRNDIAIYPWNNQRRLAFLDKLNSFESLSYVVI